MSGEGMADNGASRSRAELPPPSPTGRGFYVAIGWLVLAVVASALSVIYSKHLSRNLFAELRRAEAVRDDLNVEWGRLLLEQSTYATHVRVDRIARARLHMFPPAPEDVLVLQP